MTDAWDLVSFLRDIVRFKKLDTLDETIIPLKDLVNCLSTVIKEKPELTEKLLSKMAILHSVYKMSLYYAIVVTLGETRFKN